MRVVPIRPSVAGSAIGARELADILGRWTAVDGPLYRLLFDRIAHLADTGELPPGTRLPAERELAGAVSVSRNTVAATYQLLRDEGLAQTRQGAGTVITPHRTTPGAVHRANGFFASLLESAAVDADLTLSAVDCAPQVAAALDDPASVLSAAQRREVTGGAGYYPLGLSALRAAIAGQFTTRWQLPTVPEQVLVTTGAQQALDVLMRGNVVPGQPVVAEDPTFPGAVDALHRAGARPVRLSATGGVDPDRLAQTLRTHRPAVVYLIPVHQNPTGWVMPERDRLEVAALAAAHPDTLFVDDCALAELAIDTESCADPSAPVASLDPTLPNLVTVGSLSKTYWGGLRIGWIRADAAVISRLAAAKTAADLGSSAYPQAVAAALMDGQHDAIVRWRIDQLRVRRDALQDALRAYLPTWSWTQPHGGLTLWVRLPGRVDAGTFTQVALRHGVAVVPGRLLSATNSHHRCVRIAYTQPPERLRAAAPALARAWQSVRDS